MLACVIRSSLNPCGGAERVCLETIRTLKEIGFRVRLITMERTDWRRIRNLVGEVEAPHEGEVVLPFRPRVFGIYARLLTMLRLMSKRGCDITINTHGDVLPAPADIVYMHFPTFMLAEYAPVNVKYRRSLFWRLYFKPYDTTVKAFVKRLRNSIILTNSRFSATAIKKYLGIDGIIVYPPIQLNQFLAISKNINREDIVVSCGRFSPEKNYELVIEVATHIDKATFYIIGSVAGKTSSQYLAKLKSLIEHRKVKMLNCLLTYLAASN